MKKTVCTLLALALAGAAFTSCSKIGGKADADTTKSAGGSGGFFIGREENGAIKWVNFSLSRC